MAIVIVKDRVSRVEFNRAKKDYGSYIKLTIDLENEIVALGGEYHADAEKMLLEQGSKQENILGGGFNLETKQFETNAIINLRPGRNNSTEILDSENRERFLKIARRILKEYAG